MKKGPLALKEAAGESGRSESEREREARAGRLPSLRHRFHSRTSFPARPPLPILSPQAGRGRGAGQAGSQAGPPLSLSLPPTPSHQFSHIFPPRRSFPFPPSQSLPTPQNNYQKDVLGQDAEIRAPRRIENKPRGDTHTHAQKKEREPRKIIKKTGEKSETAAGSLALATVAVAVSSHR